MLAAVYYNNKDVRIQEMPTPEIADDEIRLVKWHKDAIEEPRFKVLGQGSLNSFIAEVSG